MAEQTEGRKSKTGLIVGIVVGVILILGIGGYFIFQSLINTPKNSYLLSEKESIDNHIEIFEERFEEELEWYEYTLSNPVETNLNITADTNDPSLNEMGISELVNSSEMNIAAASDMEEEISTISLSADIAGFSIDGVDAFLTGDNAGVTLPFIEEYLTLAEEDAAGFLSMVDPYTFDESEEIDYSIFFEDQMFTESEREYIEDEYMSFIREELPDEAFESQDEEITVGDNTVNAERLSMNLSEEELQTFLSDLFNKMADDEELMDMLRAQFTASSFGMPEDEAEQMASDVNESLRNAAEEVQNTEFPDGLSSVIWLDGDDIVQRNFDVTAVRDGETMSVSLNGTNEISDDGMLMTYDVILGDDIEDLQFTLTVDLNDVENGYEDTVTVSADEMEETVVLSMNKSRGDTITADYQLNVPFGPNMESLSLFLETESTYDDDQASTDYVVYAEDGATITRDTAALNIAQETVTVDSVDTPDLSNEVNLGQMTEEELDDYFNNTFGPAFDAWVQENFGGMGGPQF